MKYLLDTTVLSDFAKGIQPVMERLKAVSRAETSTSVVTFMEVEYGLQHDPARAKRLRPAMEALLADIRVLPYEVADARETARVRASLRKAGTPIGPFDLLIAGTALRHDLTLVTSNPTEFRRVPRLRVEDWRDVARPPASETE